MTKTKPIPVALIQSDSSLLRALGLIHVSDVEKMISNLLERNAKLTESLNESESRLQALQNERESDVITQMRETTKALDKARQNAILATANHALKETAK